MNDDLVDRYVRAITARMQAFYALHDAYGASDDEFAQLKQAYADAKHLVSVLRDEIRRHA